MTGAPPSAVGVVLAALALLTVGVPLAWLAWEGAGQAWHRWQYWRLLRRQRPNERSIP